MLDLPGERKNHPAKPAGGLGKISILRHRISLKLPCMRNKTNFTADFYDEGIFHVYNRTNNKELLFKSTENRLYFLRQYHKYIHPFVDTFCWNLLPNHFHFLVRIKMTETIKSYLQTVASQTLKPIERRFLTDTATTELFMELQWKDSSILMLWHLTSSIKGREIYFSGPLKELK